MARKALFDQDQSNQRRSSLPFSKPDSFMIKAISLAALLAMTTIATPSLGQSNPAQPKPFARFFDFELPSKSHGISPTSGLQPDQIQFVKRDMEFTKERGFGFDSSTPNVDAITGFSLIVPPGDYSVQIRLKNTSRIEGRLVILAEDRRLFHTPVALGPRQGQSLDMVVNVRTPDLIRSEHDVTTTPRVTLRGNEARSRNWDDQLNLTFVGRSEMIQSIFVQAINKQRILLAGDSTVTDQAEGDYASWGQILPRHLGKSVSVANHARSGETIKSFMAGLRWDKLTSETRPGDMVIIQFGHNDEKKQWPRTYLAPDTYESFLMSLVSDVRQRGGIPVLVTPVARYATHADLSLKNTHEFYDKAVLRAAEKAKVPYIDLNAKSLEFYRALGPQNVTKAFGKGGTDRTHHNAYGAFMIACFVAQSLIDQNLVVLDHESKRPNCEPNHPLAPQDFELSASDWPQAMTTPQQGLEPLPQK